MQVYRKLGLLALSIVLFHSCGNGGSPPGLPALQPLNVVLVLDLSNRLVTTPGQAEKDQAVIAAVLKLFEERQRRQAFITSKDQLRVVVAPQPDVPTATNDSLRLDMAMMKKSRPGAAAIGRPRFVQERQLFEQAIQSIYRQALRNPFTGSDLYTFFCTELGPNFTSPGMGAKVIVLTDGYLQFDRTYLSRRPACTYMRELDKMRAEKQNWKARFERKKLELCPCQEARFEGVEVLMLETAPLYKGSSVYEFPMIEHYWKKWFDAMGIPAQVEPHDNMVSSIRDKARAFLNN